MKATMVKRLARAAARSGSGRHRRGHRVIGGAMALLLALGVVVVATATSANAGTCASTSVLSNTTFEIDPSSNLVVDGTDCSDWLAGAAGTARPSGVLAKADRP